jgi:putative transposase
MTTSMAVSARGHFACILKTKSYSGNLQGDVPADVEFAPAQFLIVDGAAGLDKAIAAVWDGVPVQRCTVHKHRNLLAHAPERLHEDITADYTDMIYAATPEEVETRRKAFIRKWRLKHRAVVDSGDRLFTFTRLPPGQ